MKGTIFNILEDFICENFGDEMYESVLEEAYAKLYDKGPYVGPGTYLDGDFFILVTEFLKLVHIPLEEGIRAFGKYSLTKLIQKIPIDIVNFKTPQELLLNLNDVIHSEVQKLYEDADLPFFVFKNITPNSMTMIYYSKRKLYAFVMGLLDALGIHFGTEIQFSFEIKKESQGEYGIFQLSFGT